MSKYTYKDFLEDPRVNSRIKSTKKKIILYVPRHHGESAFKKMLIERIEQLKEQSDE